MTDEVDEQIPKDDRPSQPQRPLRRMILRNTAALPVMVTLANGVAGFASIHYATRGGLGDAALADLMLASWLILAALVFDAMDGRLARMTRQATDFGAQLDSLCDTISFGLAPAVLMVQAVALTREIADFEFCAPRASALGRIVMVIAVIYVCCAVLRLARFTIENAPDVLHHMYFRGLPSPAAATLVSAMVLLFGHLQGAEDGLRSARWLNVTVGVALPAMTFAVAILMISGFRYPHVVNRFVVGKKRFNHIVIAVIVIAVALVFREFALPLAAVAYAVSGPVRAIFRKFRPSAQPGGS